VIVPKDRAAGLNDTVLRASAGTALSVPLVQITNLARTLEAIKQLGVWTYGAAMEGSNSLYRTDLRGKLALVLGAEGAGLRRLTRETCDGLVHIPMPGDIESLNVSVACGVMLFEALRQRVG
jgi:23S rRNA (guanosine2251-2'-O)-methyltransferase